MPYPLFNFTLRPLEQIQPWGEPDDPNLHWFGLTDGCYWIQAGNSRLFEYSKFAQSEGAPHLCDFQVTRFYEGLLELAPYALEVVPEDLRCFIAVDESKEWNHRRSQWWDAVESLDESDELELDSLAIGWLDKRTIESYYLTTPIRAVIWSDSEFVHIEWDHRDVLFKGVLAWTAEFGRWSLPRATFIEEVRDLHSRLMSQMSERVAEVLAGALSPSIRVHLQGLQREQFERSQFLDQYVRAIDPPTNWHGVSQAIEVLEQLSRKNKG
ncbi:DUF5984 family protein [Aeoliella sp.]|uniref:DUF5984 family protein n=1 Tax=Aeoliella sp. TaxID=2795800 RepID=UPI003CCBF8B6